ncbi:VOC family protein [Fontibacillus sp. BL9]|uniref:VOC family protein n=1 Tax=Fontibacillus sp. BL9 TaxID=3389971 RepID=UPI003979F246
MLVPQLYLNGDCCDAIELYKKAFNTDTDSMMLDPEKEPEKFVVHAEMHILGQRVMLSDFGGTAPCSSDSVMELVAIFETEEVLKEAYAIMNGESTTITPIGPVFFSPCMVQFVDKFGVRWCFMI